MKPFRVKLDDADGNSYYWTVKHCANVFCCGGNTTSKHVNGWEFRDHEGYTRFFEGNWINFVPYFHLIAGNYGFTTKLS